MSQISRDCTFFGTTFHDKNQEIVHDIIQEATYKTVSSYNNLRRNRSDIDRLLAIIVQ